jgi:hypothetical protein
VLVGKREVADVFVSQVSKFRAGGADVGQGKKLSTDCDNVHF